MFSWIFTTPPGSSTDEPAHYVRALAATEGQLIGRKVDYQTAQFHSSPVSQINTASGGYPFTSMYVRAVNIPANLLPNQMGCTAELPNTTGACIAAQSKPIQTNPALTTVALYPPFYYLLTGWPMLLGNDPTSALLIGRLFSAAVALSMVIAGFWFASRRFRGPVILAGYTLAMTPMAAFVLASFSPSSWEVAGAVLLGSLLLGVSFDETAMTRPEWIAAAIAGIVVSSSRATGPLIVATFVAIAFLALHPRRIISILRSGGRWALAASSVTLIACLSTFAWDQLEAWRPPFDLASALTRWPAIFKYSFQLLVEQVGVLGWVDTALPDFCYAIWLTVSASLAVLAIRLPRRRLLLLLLLTQVVIQPIAIWTLAFSTNLYSGPLQLQGRWFLPFTMAFLIAVAMAIATSPMRVRQTLTKLSGLSALAGPLIMAVAWYVSAHRYSVGVDGPAIFWTSSGWSPPFGWYFWTAVTAAALLGMSWAVLSALRSENSQPWNREDPSE